MRILTWNINGLRTLPQYHPWTTLKKGEDILNELGADIICFQETKTSRQMLDKSFAVPDSYDAFYSFPMAKGGYSGVSVYTKRLNVVPLKAEEGLTGTLQSGLKPPLSMEEHVSKPIPIAHEVELLEDEASQTHTDITLLDQEGRALMIDCGLFVLINLYCPNETSDARLPYKMNYHLLLGERVRRLIEVEKREVIVTGDINICADPIDHCDGHLPSVRDVFWDHPARKWFHEWLHPRGPMIDIVRRNHPDRKGMYTCWNQKISARVTNYGTRIDYFLITEGLLPWFKHADIQPAIKGSDHCPVFIDLHDQIDDGSGRTLYLRNEMGMSDQPREPPRIATKYWREHLGKQKLLSTFFGKQTSNFRKDGSSPISRTPKVDDALSDVIQISDDEEQSTEQAESSASPSLLLPTNLTATTSSSQNDSSQGPFPPSVESTAVKRKVQADSNYPSSKQKKAKHGSQSQKSKSAKETTTKPSQAKLSSFFSTPRSHKRPPQSSSLNDNCDEGAIVADAPPNADEDFDDFATISLPNLIPGASQVDKEKAVTSWSKVFGHVESPNCTVHGEPTKEFKVNKPGPNKGKAFFVCARPVGPGYDAGRDKRLREEVDTQYRCNYFKWKSDVRKEAAS